MALRGQSQCRHAAGVGRGAASVSPRTGDQRIDRPKLLPIGLLAAGQLANRLECQIGGELLLRADVGLRKRAIVVLLLVGPLDQCSVTLAAFFVVLREFDWY